MHANQLIFLNKICKSCYVFSLVNNESIRLHLYLRTSAITQVKSVSYNQSETSILIFGCLQLKLTGIDSA